MSSHIFVSYKHGDDDFVALLEQQLETVGIEVWTDRELLAGDDWREGIDNAIRKAFALVVIMTPDARDSEYVTYEWSFAWGIGKKIIPLMLRDTRMHPRLESLQYMDFTSADQHPWQTLIGRLKQVEKQCLLEDLESPQWLIRQRAIKRLVELRITDALPILSRMAKRDRSKKIREVAKEAAEKLQV